MRIKSTLVRIWCHGQTGIIARIVGIHLRTGGTRIPEYSLEPNATVLEGLAVRGEDAGKDSTKEAVLSWLEGLDLE